MLGMRTHTPRKKSKIAKYGFPYLPLPMASQIAPVNIRGLVKHFEKPETMALGVGDGPGVRYRRNPRMIH